MLDVAVAESLLNTFKGRHDHIAFQPAGSTFRPLKVRGSIPIEKFVERHTADSSCGFYLLTEESTVNVVCVDLDDHDGNRPEVMQEGQAFQKFLADAGFPSYLERSWSGTGIHVWMFFDEPIPASEARIFAVGAVNDFELESVEVYPRQSKLTADKPLGNLVRYPLAGKSAFLNPDLSVVTDVLGFLSSIKKISAEQVETKLWWNTAESSSYKAEGGDYETTGLPSRVKSLMESAEGELLLKRWMGDVTGMQGQRSRSDLCFALCTEMIRNYVPTPEVEAALRYWCAQNDYEKGITRPKWISDTVRYAYDNLRTATRREVVTSDRLGVLLHSAIENVVTGEDALITTGVAGLDYSLGGGIGRGEMVIVAGRPSQGKTMTAWHILDSAAKQGVPSAFISLEMPETQIMVRHLQRITDIPKSEWGKPEVAQQLHELADADLASKSPIYFSRGGKQTLQDVVSEIRHYAAKGALVVAVDYIELILGKGSDFERVTETAKTLAALSKELHIALVVLAQLRRQPPQIRGVVLPQMSDLRTSGMIEQAADVIVGCVWPHQVDATYDSGVYNLVCLKSRNRGIKEQVVSARFYPERQLLVG